MADATVAVAPSVVDPDAARLLAALRAKCAPPSKPAAGSKRTRREDWRAENSCRAFLSAEGCKYGDKCKFGHNAAAAVTVPVTAAPTSTAEQDGRTVLRADAGKRGAITSGSEEGGSMHDTIITSNAGAAQKPRLCTVVERYYSRYYVIDVGNKLWNDQYVYLHSNRMVLLGICGTHSLFTAWRAKGPDYTPVFKYGECLTPLVTHGLDAVVGKKKRGGIWVDTNAIIATVQIGTTTYNIRAIARGMIVELNPRLIETPQLLLKKVSVNCSPPLSSPLLSSLLLSSPLSLLRSLTHTTYVCCAA
jgi:hypothetical protein